MTLKTVTLIAAVLQLLAWITRAVSSAQYIGSGSVDLGQVLSISLGIIADGALVFFLFFLFARQKAS